VQVARNKVGWERAGIGVRTIKDFRQPRGNGLVRLGGSVKAVSIDYKSRGIKTDGTSRLRSKRNTLERKGITKVRKNVSERVWSPGN